jgi:serine/threonine protein kinase
MERPWELPVNTTVGDAYRLIRRVGEGAQGAVFEARMPGNGDRRCALKVMNGALTENPEALAAFQSQAELASRLTDPHLVRVADFGTDASGQCFLVMEYLEGEDLGRRLARVGRFEPPVVSHVLSQIAAGLASLHQLGFAHLDLKPTNVFLQPHHGNRDFVKLLDYATARIENARVVNHPTALEDTLPYVAPEQASGRTEPLDQRTDQWALACIAWQMLFGRTPFAGPNAADATSLLYQIVYEDPVAVGEAGGSVPAGVMTVLRRALEKRPDDRFADMDGFVKAFEMMAGTLPPLPKSATVPAAPPPLPGTPGWAPAAPGAPGAQVWGQAAGVSEPVFLPGMSRRESQPRRSPTPRRTRMQGLRVPTQPGMAAVGGAGVIGTADGGPVAGPGADSAAGPQDRGQAAVGSWASLARPLSISFDSPRRWKWVAGLAVPLVLAAGIFLTRGGAGRSTVDVDRSLPAVSAPAPPPVAPTEPGAAWPSPPGQGPVIVPLNRPAPETVLKKVRHRRQRGQGLRANHAAAMSGKARAAAAPVRSRRQGPRAR